MLCSTMRAASQTCIATQKNKNVHCSRQKMIAYFEKIFQLRAKSLESEPNATLSDVIGKKLKNFNDNWKKTF